MSNMTNAEMIQKIEKIREYLRTMKDNARKMRENLEGAK